MVLPFHTVWKFSLRLFCFHKITFTRFSHCAHIFHIFTFSHCYAASKWDISKTYQFLNKGNSVKMWKCENVKYFTFFTAKNIKDPVWNMFEKFSHFHSLPSRQMSWSAKSRIAGIFTLWISAQSEVRASQSRRSPRALMMTALSCEMW